MHTNKAKTNIDIYKTAAKKLGLKTEFVQSAPRKKVLMISNEHKFFLASAAAPGFYPEARRWNAHFSGSKLLTQKILKRLGYCVIISREVRVADFPSKTILADSLMNRRHVFPALIKPDKGVMGQGIVIVENTKKLVRQALINYKQGSDFMIQPILNKNEYRILVINGSVVLMHSKHNPHVKGDGIQNIAQLLADVPSDKKDASYINWQHKKLKTRPNSILPKDTVFEYHLTKKPTTVFYKTTHIPSVVKKWALKLASDISTPVVGIDVFIPEDMSDIKNYVIIELNNNPGVDYLPTYCNDHTTAQHILEKVLRDYFKLKNNA